jgi:hypothetical protein
MRAAAPLGNLVTVAHQKVFPIPALDYNLAVSTHLQIYLSFN